MGLGRWVGKVRRFTGKARRYSLLLSEIFGGLAAAFGELDDLQSGTADVIREAKGGRMDPLVALDVIAARVDGFAARQRRTARELQNKIRTER